MMKMSYQLRFKIQFTLYSCYVYIPFISFSCLIALAKNLSSVLNKNSVSGQPVSFLILEKMPLVFPYSG
jgi:hypothetical protein